MTTNRKVSDRNLVMFGIPDVSVEREFSNIYSELQRRVVVQDSAPPQIKAEVVPYTAPTSLLTLDGLTTSPQLHMQSYVYNSDTGVNYASMGVDVDDELGYGAGMIWMLTRTPGTVGGFPGGPSSYNLVYLDPDTATVTAALSNIAFSIDNGYAHERRMHFVSGKIVLSEISNFVQDVQILDPSLPNWGATLSGGKYSLATSSNIPVSGSFYTNNLVVSGTKYVLSSNGYAYDAAADTWTLVLGPNGTTAATSYASNGAYMWCQWNNDLYSAPASLTPSWTLRNTDFVPLGSKSVAVMPNTGELIVAKDFDATAVFRRGISSYHFTTGVKTDRTGIFSATGLPSQTFPAPQFAGTADVEPWSEDFDIICGDNMVVFIGSIRSDALGTTLYRSHTNPTQKMWARAVWVLTGSGSGLATSATRLTETNVSDWPLTAPPADRWWNHPYSAAAVDGNTVYTWVGGTLVQDDTGPPWADVTVQVEAWIREYTV